MVVFIASQIHILLNAKFFCIFKNAMNIRCIFTYSASHKIFFWYIKRRLYTKQICW